MNKTIFAFAIGAAIGSVVTWKIVEKKYKQLADEEIASVVERFKNRNNNTNVDIKDKLANPDDTINLKFPEIPKDKYDKIINDLGYSDEEMDELLSDPDVTIKKTEDGDYEIYLEPGVDNIQPYVISPEEYGEKDDYTVESWTYYSDFVLADGEEIISDPESIIGDALEHFGDYEDDSVYVRNENIKCDYEILKDENTFSEIYGSKMNV